LPNYSSKKIVFKESSRKNILQPNFYKISFSLSINTYVILTVANKLDYFDGKNRQTKENQIISSFHHLKIEKRLNDMTKRTYKKVITSAFTAMMGLSLSNTLFIATAKADDHQLKNQNNVSSVKTVTAKSRLTKELIDTRLYEHQWRKRKVVTLQFKNIPLLTFLYAPGYDAMKNAVEVAERLDKLSQESIDATEIIVEWNEKTKDYSVRYKNQELVKVNKYIRLPDSKNNNVSEAALQATNRLRRLMGTTEKLSEIKGQAKLIATKNSKTRNIALVKHGKRAYRGRASWYGPGFHGRKTASGEIFNQNAMTAAHRSLPFGTKVKVTNMKNGRSVVVRINDRGPYSGGRIVDLSAAAARVIGMKTAGVAPVTIQILGR
jgi:rare lipoprotein A